MNQEDINQEESTKDADTTLEEEKQKEDSLERLKLYIGFAKFFATLFFGTVLTSIITGFINFKEIAIKERESQIQLELSERQDLLNYFEYTIGTDVYDRLKLSNFFGLILTDEAARKRWDDYRKNQEDLLRQYTDYDLKVQKINNLSESDITDEHLRILAEHRKLEELLDPVRIVRDTINQASSNASQVEICSIPSDENQNYSFNYSLNEKIIPNGYFTWADATRNGERIPTSETIENNIRETARKLEAIRNSLFPGKEFVVNSWYRTPEINRLVGGASRSRYLCGDAVSFQIQETDLVEAFNKLKNDNTVGGLALGEGFIHVDFRPGTRARWLYPGAPEVPLD